MLEQLDILAIQKRLPHRYPFLLLDRVIACESGQRAKAIKNVSINEPYFQGHFPHKPIMPGVLIVEAMAQLGGILLMQEQDAHNKLAVFAGIDKVRFRRLVEPGDQLVLEAELLKVHGHTGKIQTQATVNGELVTEGILLFSLLEDV